MIKVDCFKEFEFLIYLDEIKKIKKYFYKHISNFDVTFFKTVDIQ